jgi:hypothetical protein
MNTTELQHLIDTAPAELPLRLKQYTTASGTNVTVERSLIPATVPEAELAAWIDCNAQQAVARQQDGQDRHAGGELGGRWTWVYRVAHNDGTVTILEAPGNQ